MKIGLTGRLILSHTLVVVAALTVFSAVLIGTVGRQAARAGSAVDRATAYRLAPVIEDRYRRSPSWDEILGSPAMEMPGMGGPMRAPMMPMHRGAPSPVDRLLDRPILIVDENGNVLFQEGLPVGQPEIDDPRDGIAIQPEHGETVYLFVGSMIAAEPNPLSELFLRSTLRAAALTGVIVLAAILGMSVFWARSFLRPIRAVQRGVTEIAAGNYDAHVPVIAGSQELQSLAEDFNRMAAEVRRQEQSRRRFIGDAAHELRTPLTLLASRIEMLTAGLYTPDETQWTALSSDIDRLHHLVDDLQTLARTDAGKTRLVPTPQPLEPLLRHVVEHFQPVADERNIAIELRPASMADDTVAVDAERFRQILSNIIANAIRYSPDGGRIVVETEAYRSQSIRTNGEAPPSDLIEVAVEDAGPGIPRHDRSRVFDRFVRLDNDRGRHTGGSGLGLAIAAEFVELHGGTIRVTDPRHSGRGGRFVFTVPRATPDSDRRYSSNSNTPDSPRRR